MSEAAAIATLETKLEMLTDSISMLNQSVEKNNEKLERLSVLEVSHNNSSKAIERAFTAIAKLEEAVDTHIKLDTAAHRGYDKWIWMSVGFCSAISLMWSVVGYRMNAIIDDSMKAVTEMRMHIHDDKIKDIGDLQKIYPNARQP